MDVSFADKNLQDIAESEVRSDAHFGTRDGALLRQRLCELVAADTLAVAASVPTLDLRRLSTHAGGFGIRLRSQLRLVLEIADPAIRFAGNGDADLTKVGAVRILAIEECDES
jgi:plasmid maintenance system killer protein